MISRRADRRTKHNPARERTSFSSLARDKPVVSKEIIGDHQTGSNSIFLVSCYFPSNVPQKVSNQILKPIEQKKIKLVLNRFKISFVLANVGPMLKLFELHPYHTVFLLQYACYPLTLGCCLNGDSVLRGPYFLLLLLNCNFCYIKPTDSTMTFAPYDSYNDGYLH